VQHIQPDEIDAGGMTASLRVAFSRAVRAIEQGGCIPQTVLLDGNPLHMDPREVNVVKGDARCASIAAASIIAKVERDAIMVEYARSYPEYGFERNKGYASAEHRQAIGEYGLCPIHRVSFCSAFTQDTLF
jgi:ribonuclease HII